MLKNVASQKIALFAFDTTTGAAKTGDSANISVYLSKDWGAVTQLTDTTATELDSTNAKGWYVFDVTQTETNADTLLFTGKSSTANISVVGVTIYTRPANANLLSIDSNGRVDVIKVAGTTQTAGDIIGDTNDIQARLPAALTAGGFLKADVEEWKGSTAPAMTGDAFARLGAPVGASISADVASVLAAVLVVDDYVDTEIAAMPASVWAYTVEGSYTAVQFLRLATAALAAKLSGAATTTVVIRDISDTKNRVSATVDADGNRSAVTLDVT